MKLVNLFSKTDLPNYFKAKAKSKGNSSNLFLGVRGGWWGGHHDDHHDDESESSDTGDGGSGGDGGGGGE